MDKGWIKIHRSILDWEWWDDHNTTRLFLYLLLKANIEDKRWKGIQIKRGQLIASRASLSEATGISERSVRTALEHLTKTNQITIKATNAYTTITICNYDSYQYIKEQRDQPTDQPPTNHRPSADQVPTTTKELKELKNNNSTTTTHTREEKNEKVIDLMKTDDEYFEYMKTCEYWRQMVCMQLRIKEDKLNQLIKDFYLECQITHHIHNNQKDILSHFISWARMIIQRETKKYNKPIGMKESISDKVYEEWR